MTFSIQVSNETSLQQLILAAISRTRSNVWIEKEAKGVVVVAVAAGVRVVDVVGGGVACSRSAPLAPRL